jgi:hypothetical protein
VKLEKLKTLMAEYGYVAIGTWFVIWALTLAGFAIAISLGVAIESASGGLGLLGASYLATQLTKPLRIAATLGLTPIVAALIRKFRNKPESSAPPPA